VQLTPLSTHWAPRKKNKKRVQSFSDTVYSYLIITLLIFLYMARPSLLGQGLLFIEASLSHSNTPHSVGLLWISDQPEAYNSTWQHTTLTIDRHPCLWRYSNPQSQQASSRSWLPALFTRTLKTCQISLFKISETVEPVSRKTRAHTHARTHTHSQSRLTISQQSVRIVLQNISCSQK